MSKWNRVLVAAIATTLSAGIANAQFDPHGPLAAQLHSTDAAGLPWFDARTDAAGVPLPGLRTAIGAARNASLTAQRAHEIEILARSVPGLRVEDDPMLGTPRWIASTQSLLTHPVPGGFQALDVLRGFVANSPALFEAAPEEIGRARISREYRTSHNGVTHLTLQQQLGSVDIRGCEIRANLTREGSLINVSSTLLPRPSNDFSASAVELTPITALEIAALSLGVRGASFAALGGPSGPALRQSWASQDLRSDEPITSELVYFPLSRGELRSAWALALPVRGVGHTYDVIVDAATGAVLQREDRLHYLFGGTQSIGVNVYTGDSPAPGTPGTTTPNGVQFPFVSRSLLTIQPSEVTTWSPNGWIDDNGNETLGNNVDAHSDLNNDNVADLPRPQGNPARVFDFPQDNNQAPSTYTQAAIVNFFYLANRYHDRLYALGFDEAAGNFQTNNFGLGGIGNDPVLADCQDGGGTNNANFGTGGNDGSTGRCQMYVFTGSTPDRDGSLDADIVYHELTHGTSIRLHGGLSGTQPGGMGEGWSDFFGRCLNSDASEDPDAVYSTGAYATYLLGGSFVDNYYFGIRRFPYSTDLNKNPTTIADTDPAQQSYPVNIPRSPIIGNTANEVHNIGEVWCNMLLECRANLIHTLGFPGNDLMMQLVIDGMKLSPGNPTFLQARDAILQADLVDEGGAHLGELWSGFAKRGAGFSASSPASSTTSGIVEAFDVPLLVIFAYPAGHPAQLQPGTPTNFEVDISGLAGTLPTPGTGQLSFSINGAPYQTVGMTQGQPNHYTATLPATTCLDVVRYYFTTGTNNGPTSDPAGAPASSYAATAFSGVQTSFADDFEANLGWSVGAAGDSATTGIWERADPEGTGAQPEDDHTPSGTLCFVTGATAGASVGANDIDGGATTLVSPLFDLAADPAARVGYWRWYSNDQGSAPNADIFRVDISNNGGSTWVNAETVGPAGAGTSGGWSFHDFRVADFVAPTSQVRVRFVAEDAGTGSVVEAGIDDFTIQTLLCNSSVTPYCFGDGGGAACPCANLGGPGVGCGNSTGQGGGLAGAGTVQVSSDSFVLSTSGTPANATVVFFQGVNQDNGGAGIALFDGLRCVSGSVIRLGVKASSGGSASYPQLGDVSISVRGQIPLVGATRHYQAQYRDPANFCTAATSNFTNGVTAIWVP
ncbi:MAG: M36 family metallopeptidase [Planctomycetes bacterium]|nr:M36 family metallopeptidase [Planctomycetota bacterium]